MANKTLFNTAAAALPQADTRNEAGGKAYSLDAKTGLAQLAATGTFNATFYADENAQLAKVLELAAQVDSVFLAKLAIYSRQKSYMKDMPAALLALLAARAATDEEARNLLREAFPRVCDNMKMVRNFVQMIRSNQFGRKSFGSTAKKLIAGWINNQQPDHLFRQSVGQSPSLADVIRMVHPCPKNAQQAALYLHVTGYTKRKGETDEEHQARVLEAKASLPALVRAHESWKAGETAAVPNVDFRQLDGARELSAKDWTDIMKTASWHTLRMNLNTFNRHHVFEDKEAVAWAVRKLVDAEAIARSKVFPYQLLMAYLHANDLPKKLTLALQDAMELAVSNVPAYDGQVVVIVDVSGSMSSAITGRRAGSTSKARCVDVAALIGATILRQNPEAIVLPFDTSVHKTNLNPRDSVMTMAQQLAAYGGGGTAMHLPFQYLNQQRISPDFVIVVSDNQSWIQYYKNPNAYSSYGQIPVNMRATGVAAEWKKLRSRKKSAKLAMIDIQPYGTVQAPDDKSVLNVGGFSDTVWEVLNVFQASGGNDHWTKVIEEVEV